MELTGKCKEDFINWSDDHDISDSSILAQWHKVPISMKFGFYQEFFDSKGLNISIEYFGNLELDEEQNGGFEMNIYNKKLHEWQDVRLSKKREDAQIAAIEKANELYNNQP